MMSWIEVNTHVSEYINQTRMTIVIAMMTMMLTMMMMMLMIINTHVPRTSFRSYLSSTVGGLVSFLAASSLALLVLSTVFLPNSGIFTCSVM